MNHNDKEKWIEDVMSSMDGSRRAEPRPELFREIEEKILATQGKVVHFNQWKYAAAAAVLVFLVNATALMYYGQNNGIASEEVAISDVYDHSLISMSQIYER